VFTRALLEQAAKDVEQIRLTTRWKETITIPHVYGTGHTVITHDRWQPCELGLSHSFRMSNARGAWPPYNIGLRTIAQVTATDTVKPDEPQHLLRLKVASLPDPDGLPEMRGFEAKLLASRFWKTLMPKLEKLEVRVENIVCAAFGNVYNDSPGKEKELVERRISQHLFACAISNFLSEHYASTDTQPAERRSIPIVAFDPLYTLRSMHMLSHLSPSISVVSSPHHFLSITRSSLVLTIHMPAFVAFHEVIADLCYPSGPAAIINMEVLKYPWHEQGIITHLDQWTPRVGEMLDGYDHPWIGHAVAPEEKSPGTHWMEKLHLYARKK